MPTLKEYRNRLDKILAQRTVSNTDLLALIAEIQLAQANLLQSQISPIEPIPIIRKYKLDTARTESSPERIDISGNYFSAYTNGIPENIQIKFESDNVQTDLVPLSRFNNMRLSFDKFYLVNDAQQDKTITFFIGKKNASAGSSGIPRWGTDEVKSAAGQLNDLAELAVRMGSIDYYHRYGDIVFIDGFENGVGRWFGTSHANPGTAGPTSAGCKDGGISCMFVGSNIGAAPTQTGMYTTLRYPLPGIVSVEFSFLISQFLSYFELDNDFFSGNTAIYTGIRYDLTTNQLQYRSSSSGWTKVIDGVESWNSSSQYVFHTIKLFVDIVNRKYVRCMVDNNTYDLGGISAFDAAGIAASMWRVSLKADWETTLGDTIYVDNVIIKQNEI